MSGLRAKFVTSLAAAAMLATLSRPAAASAIYTWVSAPGTTASGTLTISDAAFLAGHLSGADRRDTVGFTDPNLISLDFQVTTGDTGFTLRWGSPITPFDVDTTFQLDYSLDVVGDELTGRFLETTVVGDVEISGTDPLSWGITTFSTDNHPHYCPRGVGCDASGYWQLTNPPAPPSNGVPEPASAALLLAGLGAVWRRKRFV